MAITETITVSPSDPLLDTAREAHSIQWRAVFAGAFVSILVYFIMMSLGIAVGGMGATNVISGETAPMAFGISAGIWTLCSALLALLVGSYATSRVSGLIATRVGMIQGGVVASLFFIFMMSQVGVALGIFSQGFAGAGGAPRDLAREPAIVGMVEDTIADLSLKSPIDSVAVAISTRILRGEMNGAAHYLAGQAGITPQEAADRLQMLGMEFQSILTEVGEKTATVARTVGWTAFGSMLLGALAGILGGAVGAQRNLRKPLDGLDRRALQHQKPAYA